jgi:hypothetical protein
MLTFQADAQRTKAMMAQRPEVAQNALCDRCKRTWRDHFAGRSATIPNGACPDQWETQFVEGAATGG